MSVPEPQKSERVLLPSKVSQEHAELAKEYFGSDGTIIKDGDFYIGCCAFCFEPKVRCVPVAYDCLNSFYEQCGASPFALACCEQCFNSDREELFLSYVDAVMILELARWVTRNDANDFQKDRKGLIQNRDDFYTFKRLAIKRGVFAREARRHSSLKYRKVMKNIMRHSDKGTFTPNVVYQQLLQKLYNEKQV